MTRTGGERPIPVSVRLTGVDGRKTIEPLRQGLTVTRHIEVARIVKEKKTWVPLTSGATVDLKDELRVVVQISSEKILRYILLESPLPAGTEVVPGFRWEEDWWENAWYGRREVHDDRVVIADSYFSRGKEEFHFRIRATNPGTYHILPTTAHAMYAPQIRGRSDAFILRIERGHRSN